jgi:hypothetical protein
MADYWQHLNEDQRLVLLRILMQMPSYRANSSVLCSLLSQFGHAVSRDVVKTHLAWLQDQHLLRIETISDIMVATLTERGSDVAQGLAIQPGVKRPGA